MLPVIRPEEVRTTAHALDKEQTYRISELAAVCGVSARTIDYYTQRGLLEPSARSRGRQRRYDEAAVRRLWLIKELQAERLTLREITQRLALASEAAAPALTARLRVMEEELDRLNRELVTLRPGLDSAQDPATRQAVGQVAAVALAKTLALAQWLAAIVREGQSGPLP